MKIITYNINGINSSTSKGLLDWLGKENADIVCLQEVRAKETFVRDIFQDNETQLSLFSNTENPFSSYQKIYNCGNVAGYAGTMILCKEKPDKIVYGIDGEDDNEGRCITIFYKNFVVINCYVPNGGSRLEFKMQYFSRLTKYLQKLTTETNVIFCSDANIAHTEQDLSHPKECSKRTGFLAEERIAFSKLLDRHFCDVVRVFRGNEKVYTWRSYRSRTSEKTDFGWKYRFDYILVSNSLTNNLISCNIPDLVYSDHLPIIVEIKNF